MLLSEMHTAVQVIIYVWSVRLIQNINFEKLTTN